MAPNITAKGYFSAKGEINVREREAEPANIFIMPSIDLFGYPKSYPTQDEPEGEVRFQYKMSLERMAC